MSLKEKDVLNIINKPGLLVAKDLNHRIIAVSDDFSYLLGYHNKNQLIGLKDEEVKICAHLAEQFYSHDKIAFNDNDWSGYENAYLKYYNDVTFYTTRTPIISTHQQVIGMFSVSHIISKGHRLFKKKNNAQLFSNKTAFIKNSMVKLTTRELQCLYYLIQGKSAKIIGEILKLSPRTIEYYLENIKNKFGVNKRSDLIELVIDLDLF